MRFQGNVQCKAIKLPEAGIVEIDVEAQGDYNYPTAGAFSGRKGDKTTRRFAERDRPLVQVSGWLDLPSAHVVAESYVGTGEESDLPVCTLSLQFAIGVCQDVLARRLLQREGLAGDLLVQSVQLELPFKSVGAALLRAIGDGGEVTAVTISTGKRSVTLT